MKIIKLPKPGQGHIVTPLLSPEEAAAYLNISESFFSQLIKKYPCNSYGTPRTTAYHIKDLLPWFKKITSLTQEDKNNDSQNRKPMHHNRLFRHPRHRKNRCGPAPGRRSDPDAS